MKEYYNAADEKQVKDKEKVVANERRQELEDIRTIINTPAGKRFFKRLMKDGRIYNTTFTGNSYSYFLEGNRNLALRYFNDICEAAPDKLIDVILIKERRKNND